MKKTQKRVSSILADLRGGHSLLSCCKAANIDPHTFYNWMEQDPKLKAEVNAVRDSRHLLVEETVYGRIISGKASPAEIIFYLKNRAPERWKDKQRVEIEDNSASAALRELLRRSGEPAVPATK